MLPLKYNHATWSKAVIENCTCKVNVIYIYSTVQGNHAQNNARQYDNSVSESQLQALN